MIDTIALTLNYMEFEVKDLDAFSPSARGLLQQPYYRLGGRGNFSCTQNPTKKEFEQGIYKPRLTLTKRCKKGGFAITLRVEFSAPKLLFRNNFDELTDADFEKILDILQRRLSAMGVVVRKDILRKAGVSAIHYSKNIALTDYSTCTMITEELAKTSVSKRLDSSKTDYRNEGHAIRYHTNSYEIAFYDKMKDLQQSAISEKRGVENDNAIQKDLFDGLDVPKQLEVLRMEVRLGNRTKIRSVLFKLKIKTDITFQALFSHAISQKVLKHYWNELTVDMPLLALSQFKPEDIIQGMLASSNGSKKPAVMLKNLGALMLINSIGIRGAKALMEKQATPKTWQRIKKELEGLDISANTKYAAVSNVQSSLNRFEPLKTCNLTELGNQH